MKEMKKQNFSRYKTGRIKMEVHTAAIEKYLNLLWKNKIYVSNIASKDMTTYIMEIFLRDYIRAKKLSDNSNVKIKILGRKGYAFYVLKLKKRVSIIIGIGIFVSVLYYLSGFIWTIDIKGDCYISPYEIRQQLKEYGVTPGIRKSKVSVFEIEQKLMHDNSNLMWVKIRAEGTSLNVSTAQRQSPPSLQSDTNSGDAVAKRTAQILRIYTQSGTAMVKPGDIVSEGQIIIKAEQGKEGATYSVPAKGNVIAKTFYEEENTVPITVIKKERTGPKYTNYYISIKDKKYYFVKCLNNFDNYDKIIDNSGIMKKETFYELSHKKQKLDYDTVVKEASEKLYNSITLKLYSNTKILDKRADVVKAGDNIHIIMHVVAEEDICQNK